MFGVDKAKFRNQADDLLECITNARDEVSRLNAINLSSALANMGQGSTRPLILIGHSLGGILIRQALVNAYSFTSRYRPIKEST